MRRRGPQEEGRKLSIQSGRTSSAAAPWRKHKHDQYSEESKWHWPSDRKVRGLNASTLKYLPLSLAPKSYCGEVPTCVLTIFLWTTWTLRCQSCHKTFDITLKTTERMDRARWEAARTPSLL